MRILALILLAGPFAPNWCAARTQRVSARTVWAAYVLGLALGTATLLAGVYLAEWYAWTALHRRGMDSAPFRSSLWQIYLAVVIALGIAVTYFAALIAAPLAWRDEPWRDTWRHALRTVRLFAPAWMLPAALSGVAVIAFVEVANGPGPRLVHFILILSWTVLPAWCFGIIGKAASAERPVPAPLLEPVCESCGYLLHHVPASRRCPECGADVGVALDPAFRWFPPARGEQPPDVPMDLPFASLAAWTQARAFFQRVRLDAPAWPLVLRAANNHLLAGGIALCTFLLGLSALTSGPPIEVLAVGTGLAAAIATMLFGVWSAGVGIIGLCASAAAQRNLLRAALVVAAYASAFPLAWAFFSTGNVVGMIAWGMHGRLRSPFWPLVILAAQNAAFAVGYIQGVWRRMRYVRYGNWRFAEEDDLQEGLRD